MTEPTLAFAAGATTYTDSANKAIEVFSFRGGYIAEAQKDLYKAWTEWAATSGDTDKVAIEENYSAYAFTVWIDSNGFPDLAVIL